MEVKNDFPKFEVFITSPKLAGFITRYLLDHSIASHKSGIHYQDAHDLATDAYLEACNTFESGKGAQAESWIFTTLRFKLQNHFFPRCRLSPLAACREVELDFLSQEDDETTAPAAWIEWDENVDTEQVFAQVAALPASCRAAARLALAGAAISDIAKQTKASESAVRRYLDEAAQMLSQAKQYAQGTYTKQAELAF